LLQEGTQTRTSTDISDESDFIAARPSIGTDRENLVASTEALTKHWPRALNLLADVVLNPVFPENEVERVRRERLTDLRRVKDDANAIADRVEPGILYGRESPQGHPVGGRETSIAAFSRAELAAAHETEMLANRPTFHVVGDVDAQEVA